MISSGRYRIAIASLVLLVRGLSGLIWVAPGPLFPLIMSELNISRGTASWLVSLPAIVMVLFSIPISLLVARVGAKRSFTIGGLLQAAGLFTLFSSSFPVLLLTRWFYALGATITFPVAGGLIAQWFSVKERPFMNGLNTGITTLGTAVAMFATAPLAILTSWRGALTVYGVLAFVSSILWLIFGKEARETASVKTKAESPAPRRLSALSSELTTGQLFRQPSVWLLAFSLLGINCLLMATSSWLPTYYYEVFNMPLVEAGIIASIINISGIVACFAGGLLPVWLGLRKPLLLVPGLLVPLAALGCFLFDKTAVILISAVLFGFLIRVSQPSVWTVAMELPGVTLAAVPTVISIALAFGSIGGFLGPSIVGYFTDLTGSYLPGLIVSCILSLSLFFCGLFLPETGPRARRS